MAKDGLAYEIELGGYDDELEEILVAVYARRKAMQASRKARNRLQLKPGDRVKLVNVSPKALNGATGTIKTSPYNGKLGIQLDFSYRSSRGRLYDSKQVYTWPLDCYVKLDAEIHTQSTVQYSDFETMGEME